MTDDDARDRAMAERIREAAEEFQNAINEARRAGLSVSIDQLVRYQSMGMLQEDVLFNMKVERRHERTVRL